MSDPQNKLSGRPSSDIHGQPQKFLSHLANHCPGCTCEIRKECLKQINNDNNNQILESSSTQQPISNFYESTLSSSQLHPAYQPPSRSVLSGKFLDTEISNVNNKLNSILENNKNLTLVYLMKLFLNSKNISSCNIRTSKKFTTETIDITFRFFTVKNLFVKEFI
ncbi:10664_t:CDS:2, partial [Entrophospora sp. SA101]